MKKEFRASRETQRLFQIAVALYTMFGLFGLAAGIYVLSTKLLQALALLLIFLGFLQFLVAWLYAITLKSTRLVFTPENIEFHSPGLALTTSWSNLERIHTRSPLIPVARFDSLVLRDAALQQTAWWFRLFRTHPERQIPLSMFPNWRVSEIGEEIRRYAPQLFVDNVTRK